MSSTGFAARGSGGPYVRAIASHRLVVLIVAIATILGASAYLTVRHSTYEATLGVLFTPLQQGDRSSQGLPLVVASADPTRDIQTAASLLHAPQAAARAAQRLGPGWNRAQVAAATNVQPNGQSNILVITADASTPAEAARIASNYATATLDARRALLQQRATAISPTIPAKPSAGDTTDQQLRADINLLLAGSDPNFSIVHTAAADGTPTDPPAKLVLLLACVGGLALGAVAALILELLSNRVRDSDDLQELYPVPIRARLPRLRPAGRNPFQRRRGDEMTTTPDYAASLQLLVSQLEERADGDEVVFATGASAKEGTTTTLLHLARALADSPRQVLVVDCDLQKRSATSRLALEGARGLSDVVAGAARATECIVSSPRFPSLSVLPAGTSPAALLGRDLPEIIEEARRFADWILIDSGPLAQATDLVPALKSVDEVLVIASPGQTRRADFRLLRDLLEDAPTAVVGLVVVGGRGRPRMSTTLGRVRADGVRAPRMAANPPSSLDSAPRPDAPRPKAPRAESS
jgi:Mrp family chromosome partitioning ATPase/capsular polysaccharide biosynthesis protein